MLKVETPQSAPDGPWIQTFTGKMFPLYSPGVWDIDIEDIANALSMICRFGGHTSSFYSVAEHCINVANEVDPKYAFDALMHDAAEAYIGDMVTPLKRGDEHIQQVELRIEAAIARRYQIALYDNDRDYEVKRADWAMCIYEAQHLLPRPDLLQYWTPNTNLAPNSKPTLWCWKPQEAKKQFLRKFNALHP